MTPEEIKAAVFEALDNTIVNGYRDAIDDPEEALAVDLATHDAALDEIEPDNLIPHIKAWRMLYRLRARIGKSTCISCTITLPRIPGAVPLVSGPHVEHDFGGCGLITGVVEREGSVYVQTDEGMEWLVQDDDLVIEDYPS